MVGMSFHPWTPIVQRVPILDDILQSEFWMVREDLLPFPLSGNKVRKVDAELRELQAEVDVVITNGGVDSNYCRTLAFFAASRGTHAHLVLHGDTQELKSTSVHVLTSLGATFDIGAANTIARRIDTAKQEFERQGKKVHVLSGGGHSIAGAEAFKLAGKEVFLDNNFDQVFVASGTGATQGGLVAAAELYSPQTQIVGISVARTTERGVAPIEEAARWAGSHDPSVTFDDRFRAGGYGVTDGRTSEACEIGWSHGVPLDRTYTGKAFAGLIDYSQKGLLGSRVLFWHTGGLMNWIAQEFKNEEMPN